MIRGYQGELLKTYEEIRAVEEKAFKERVAKIQALHPEIIDVDNEIQKKSLHLPLAILKSKGNIEEIEKLKNDITDLRAQKYEMLVSKGYDPEYLNIHYRCKKCSDTGYIGVTPCECTKNKLIKLYYKDSSLEETIKDSNFSNFDINLFSSHKLGNEKYSPRRNMEKMLDYILNDYLATFENNSTNLLFFGNPGSGKSFLSYCISKALLDSGYLVIYKTSDELIKNLKDIRFNNNKDLEDILIDCDLLIIDDLGAEQLSEFSVTELFTLLNKKLLKKKKMLISTNLTLPDVTKIYSERIASRLIGNFKLCKFFSEDIRIKINLEKNR